MDFQLKSISIGCYWQILDFNSIELIGAHCVNYNREKEKETRNPVTIPDIINDINGDNFTIVHQ